MLPPYYVKGPSGEGSPANPALQIQSNTCSVHKSTKERRERRAEPTSGEKWKGIPSYTEISERSEANPPCPRPKPRL